MYIERCNSHILINLQASLLLFPENKLPELKLLNQLACTFLELSMHMGKLLSRKTEVVHESVHCHPNPFLNNLSFLLTN